MKNSNSKSTIGRPTKYLPEMCETVIELMREGHSKTSVAARLNIDKDTLYEWCKEHSEFSDAVRFGVTLSEAWWEEHGRGNLYSKEFNNNLWHINMKNRFGWRDKETAQLTITHQQEESLKDLE